MSEGMHETESESPDIAGPGAPAPEESEQVSVFLPKSALMGKEVKEGDAITMTVKSVDPETGDVEAVCDYEGGGGGKSMMDMMDEEVPEEV